MARGESGYKTLRAAKRVPLVPSWTVNSWNESLDVIDRLITEPQGVETLVLDALSGFEGLCHELVCDRDFKGDWGDKGFLSYHKGYDLSVKDWLILLVKLDKLRDTHGIAVLMLSHAQVRPYKNPVGEDFDRFAADMHAKTWAPTHKWADAVLFGNFYTVIDKSKGGRAKGIGGTERVLYTERRDAWDAKNRYGMPECIDIKNERSKTWETIARHIQGNTDD